MRMLAEEMKDLKSLSIMHGVADDYDKLADRAEERAQAAARADLPISTIMVARQIADLFI
jgi:hypothetical protein